MMRLILPLLILAPPLAAQAGSDIYVVNVERFAGGIRIGRPANVTARPGYDNQPAFLPDGSAILYTSIRDDGQADTYQYDLTTRQTTRLTETAESEYSPTLMADGRVSVVRVERDSVQRLWAFGVADGAFELLFPDLAPVGYYAWLDGATAAAFVLGDPPTLQIARTDDGDPVVAARDIGRTIARVPGTGALSFVQRRGPDELWVVTRPVDGDTVEFVARLPGAEFFAWTPDGALLAADDRRILLGRPGSGTVTWMPVADFTGTDVGPITRIAMSPQGDWLAFVAGEP